MWLNIFGAILIWVGMGAWANAGAENLMEQVREVLESRVENMRTSSVVCQGELVCQSSVLPRFYELRSFRPAWSDDRGPLPQAESLLQALEGASREGLRGEDYHLPNLAALLSKIRQEQAQKIFHPQDLADLDLLLSDSFLTYASHLRSGRVNPETIQAEWHIRRQQEDFVQLLQNSLDGKQIEKGLQGLLPSDPGYVRLREVLQNYRGIARTGGWPEIPPGRTLHPGDRDARVGILRVRLGVSGDLPVFPGKDDHFFDAALSQAVRNFQQRHGLAGDGVVGPATLAALNVKVEGRIRQLEASMERWRWLPRDLGKQYITINIANFGLQAMENGRPVLNMRVIVGRRYQRTPNFSATMTYLVFDPYWNVPTHITRKEMIPMIARDPEYLSKNHLRVYEGWGPRMKEIDPRTIDWNQIIPGKFIYHIRQDPGPTNALGRLKFMLPNKFDIYLHDTPVRELFQKTDRDFSHGCIRIEKAVDLAEYLLKPDPEWTRENILAAIEESKNKTVRLPRPIPVYVLYWTAWVDEDGTVQFRKDIYGRDEQLEKALMEKPPR